MYPEPTAPRQLRVLHPHLVARLGQANRLSRLLRELGVAVRQVDLSQERPILEVTDNVLHAVPMKGILRQRTDSGAITCSAILEGCVLVWTEGACAWAPQC